jgi:predicted NAD/FAD-binding protein
MKIAVIGGGIAGISAAHYLSRTCEVTLLEASSRLGGHANPISVAENGTHFHLDTGFVIFNQLSYPCFLNFLNEIEAHFDIVESDMSIGFYHQLENISFSTGSLGSFFPNLAAWLKPERYLILRDLWRFRQDGLRAVDCKLGQPSDFDITIGEYLQKYSKAFREYLALPLVSLVWSVPKDLAMQLPASNLLRFLHHHGHFGKPKVKNWRSFRSSSAQYLQAFQRQFKGRILLNSSVESVAEDSSGQVRIQLPSGEMSFDRVVIALHADDAYRILAKPSRRQKELLAPWQYFRSTAYLHTDTKILGTDPKLWSCWNTTTTKDGTFMSYYLNRIHSRDLQKNYFLSLDPIGLEPSSVIQSMKYKHPIFDKAALERQSRLQELNTDSPIVFCGSYFGYGFHEDAVKSGKSASETLLRGQLVQK